MIEPTEEMRAAVKRRMGVPDGQEMDPWMGSAIEDVLAIVERDQGVAAVARVHRQFEGRCVECVEWCECANRDNCTHGNVPWPCLTAKVGGFA